ncbi:GFA family protein [Palleronia caenipelagi]|uniref:GFA family protein n=1 Tax=Palleronia caenipelagi TaxID=2489174 RepID=A0A547Q9H8_9RHOB|nr:GFA family protein [Palleronia caenipelagi]TRD23048.1 GFA family protein [Palleronia caenipelagi]
MATYGHCLCGATHFHIDLERVFDSDICHCESCRRATGAPLVASFALPDTAWRWRGQVPGRYASSTGVTRYFCTTCGTPLAYQTTDLPGETHFHTATLNEPEHIPPTRQSHADEALDWAAGMLSLPKRKR